MSKTQFIQGNLRLLLLQLLVNNGKMYGYEIMAALESASKGNISVSETGLYKSLQHARDAQLIKETTAIVAGRQRRYFQITAAGKNYVQQETELLKEQYALFQKILKFKLKK